MCSKWRQVALSTGALWSNVVIFHDNIIQDYERRIGLYWRRLTELAPIHYLTVTIYLGNRRLDKQRVFQDFILPFRFNKLSIRMTYYDLHGLSNLPTLDVEDFAITLKVVPILHMYGVLYRYVE